MTEEEFKEKFGNKYPYREIFKDRARFHSLGMIRNQVCQLCSYWSETDLKGFEGAGRCKRYPPTSPAVSDQQTSIVVEAVFPFTAEDETCGEFLPHPDVIRASDKYYELVDDLNLEDHPFPEHSKLKSPDAGKPND